MRKLVTIGIPIYKRLEYLPNVLRVVEAQDYPEIDILVSDNGMNGTAVSDVVKKHCTRPYRFRQNSATVSGPRKNQRSRLTQSKKTIAKGDKCLTEAILPGAELRNPASQSISPRRK